MKNDLFNADEYFKDKAARLTKEHAKSFELMSQKFEKLQASFKKQAGELEFYDTEDFYIEVEGGLSEKFKMSDLLKFDGIEDPKTNVRSYMIV